MAKRDEGGIEERDALVEENRDLEAEVDKLRGEVAKAKGEAADGKGREEALREALEPFTFPGLKLSGVEAATFNYQVPEAWVVAARGASVGKEVV